MRSFLIIILSLITLSALSQRTGKRELKKEDFIHTWKLFEIRNSSNSKITNKVEDKVITFTQDSVFIIRSAKKYAGIWKFQKGQIYLNIEGTSEFDYKWSVKGFGELCLRVGNNNSKLQCFKRQD